MTPLAIATGASSASQNAIGIAVLGGMISATLLAVIFVPAFFAFVMKWMGGKPRRKPGHDAPKPPPGDADGNLFNA